MLLLFLQASFVALVCSDYNLIECGYLFQTNLSKQWIENIRTAKASFQLLMEESKMKLQNAHQSVSTPIHSSTTPPSSSVSTNTIHQSFHSLSSTSLNSSVLKSDASITNESNDRINENARRSSKVESDVFKIVEQTRRNSRTDRKNFGRYFTADGTGTHASNGSALSSPSSSMQPMLSSLSSGTITKRMSWNNEHAMEKNDSSLITNSFRSVHSSSGVSSTGSFLFSTDEDSSITTTTSSSIPAIKSDEDDGKSSLSTITGTHEQNVPVEDDHQQTPSVHCEDSMPSDSNSMNQTLCSVEHTIEGKIRLCLTVSLTGFF